MRINGLLVTAAVALGVCIAYDKFGKHGGAAGFRRGA